MIRIKADQCDAPAVFDNLDVALAFLRTIAGQLQQADFVAVVVAAHGPTMAKMAEGLMVGCFGAPV